MKKIFILLAGIFLSAQLSAQQLPLFSQYYFNSFVYNPAHAGLDKESRVTLVARKQFTGLANSIGTYAATFQSGSTDKKSGFGLYVYNDNVNLFRSNVLSGSYAYHVPLKENRTLSFGLALSALDHRYNASNFHLIHNEDPVIQLLGSEGGFTVDANAGVNLDLGKFSMGLANLQMLKNQEEFKGNTSAAGTLYTLANHWMFNAGYKIKAKDNLTIEPYLLYRKTKNVPGQVDLNVFANFTRGYAGIAYRDGMSFSTMLGLNVSPNATIGYSYDITTSDAKNALGNTHEVILKFNLRRNNPTPGPAQNILASKDTSLSSEEKEYYEDRIGSLESELTSLKNDKSKTVDTVIVDRVVIKEVLKVVPMPTQSASETKTASTTYTPQTTTPTPTPQTSAPTTSYTTEPVETPIYTPNTSDPYTITDYNTDNSSSSSDKFYVIAGSFATAQAATSHINKLRLKGITAKRKFDNASGRHYVHVGDFWEKTSAVDRIQGLKPYKLPLWVKSM